MDSSRLRATSAAALLTVISACGGTTGVDADAANRAYVRGDRHATGRGAPFDLARARAEYGVACEAGHARACAALAWAWVRGPIAERDVPRARALSRAACDRDDLLGCTHHAAILGLAADDDRDVVVETSLHRRACEGGEPVGCVRLGRAYERGVGTEPDVAEARSLYERACSASNGEACGELGRLDDGGVAGPRCAECAARQYERACDLGDGLACSRLGDLLLRDDAAEGARAFALHERGCGFGEPRACTMLAHACVEGRGVEPDVARARALYRASCGAGDARACRELGALDEAGIGGGIDLAAAARAYAQACEGAFAAGCTDLGRCYAEGLGVPQDLDRARETFALGCGLGDANACRSQDGLDVRSLEHACRDARDLDACVEAAEYYDENAPDAPERAAPLYERACGEGRHDPTACISAAERLGASTAPDGEHIARLLRAACDADEAQACLALGFHLLFGRYGTARDLAGAEAAFEPSCEDGFDNGCLGVAIVLSARANDAETGLGTRPNAARARALYAQSCRAHESGPGCFQVDRLARTRRYDTVTYGVTLDAVENAPAWASPGAACEITVEWTMDEDPVWMRATCGGRPIFPTFGAVVWSEEDGIDDHETSAVDGTPSIRLVPTDRTFTLEDDERGPFRGMSLRGRVTRLPEAR